MFVPLRYNLRSMARRRTRTGLTVLGIAAVVSVYVVMASVGRQMRTLFTKTGQQDEVVVQQAGSLGPEFSSVSRASITWLRAQPGIAAGADGAPLVSPELIVSGTLAKASRGGTVMVRGVTADALRVYRGVRISAGEAMGPGRKVMVGQQLARSRRLSVGDVIGLEGEDWTVAGLFDAGGRVYDQEIWTDLDELGAATNRADISGMLVRATGAREAAALVDAIDNQRAEPLRAQTSEAAFARVGGMSLWMAALGRFIAIVIAIGAVFGGMNTMYAAVSVRMREIGVLRALGFRAGAVLLSFTLESVALALLGGALGGLLAYGVARIPMDMPFLLDGAVHLQPADLVSGLVLSVFVGVLGGLMPSVQAARVKVVNALR